MLHNKQALYFVFITVLLDAIGIGIIIPVMPKLIVELTGQGLSYAAIYGGWLLFIYSLMQFFCAPILGNLSDCYGRRPVLLFSLVSLSINYAIMSFAPNLYWLFLGRLFTGIAGATYGTAAAYVADVSSPKERAQNFGLIGAAFGVGFIVGPALGGILGEYGTRIPFYCSSVLALLVAIYGFFVAPETLTKERRRPFLWKRANPIGALLSMKQFPIVSGLLIVLFVAQIARDSYASIWTYYSIESFKWSESEIGYSLALVGILLALVQGKLIRVVIPKIGERKALLLGLFMAGCAFTGFAFARQTWVACLFIVVSSLGGFIDPSIRAIMSNQIDENQQGELQGAISSLVSFSAILSPIIMTQTFSYFTGKDNIFYFPGAPFALAAILIICSMLILLKVQK
ncbi:TCR/Tet family MFS transporter [Candidatus Uabimicrobium sp. HlEnr_7]|uniref:TCR/Tet family MFS transporter n=1 Tax=Candidatus Uabimicrobium helgolandensis TaxID=3095367 RepID=UPI0035565967